MNEPAPRTELVVQKPHLAKELLRGALTARGRAGGTGELPRRILRLPRVRVDTDNLYAYQRLCGFPVSDRLPHPYPHLLGFGLQAQLMAAGDFPLPLPGLVHLSNESTLLRPLVAADRPDLGVWAENLKAHPKGWTVELHARAEIDGAVAWESVSTYLHRGPAGDGGPASAQPAAPGVPRRPLAARWRLTADLGRRYAAVSGDVNPIHLHPLTARTMGFPRAIAHGMWTFARTMAALGHPPAGPATARVWFRKPVLLPGTVGLVRETAAGRTVAALVGPGTPEQRRTHLVLELTAG